MEGFNINNAQSIYLGQNLVDSVYLGPTKIWPINSPISWVTIPSYRTIYNTDSTTVNVPNFAMVETLTNSSCYIIADTSNNQYNFTYMLDSDTSYAYRNQNFLVFDVNIHNVDNFTISVTTNVNPSSGTNNTNCWRTNRTTEISEAVSTIPSMRFTIREENSNTSLYSGWLNKSTTYNQTFSSLDASKTYEVCLMLTFEDSNRTYDYYCNPSNINGPTFEMQINTNTTS